MSQEINVGKSTEYFLSLNERNKAWLARKLEVSHFRAGQITNNKNASTKTINKLCVVFGVTPTEFIKAGLEDDK
jgi:plasmid maintenance system antidote protein VapI